MFHVALERYRDFIAVDLGAALRMLDASLRVRSADLLVGGFHFDGGFASDIC